MAVEFEIERHIKTAELAVKHAQDVRAYHRRRTSRGSMQREYDIREARERIARAMKPLRSWLGQSPYKPQTEINLKFTAQVAALSKQLQAERRKLWKMSTTRGVEIAKNAPSA